MTGSWLLTANTASELNRPTAHRVVSGSILCDPIQPNPSADWPNPIHYKWENLDPTRPNPTTNKFNCFVQPNLISPRFENALT